MKLYMCRKCDDVYLNLIEHNGDCDGHELNPLEVEVNGESYFEHEIYLRKTGNIVTITAGLDHPMIDVHHIKFMIIETMHGTFLRRFELNSESSVTLFLAHDEEIEKVYVYCSVHGLLQYTEFK